MTVLAAAVQGHLSQCGWVTEPCPDCGIMLCSTGEGAGCGCDADRYVDRAGPARRPRFVEDVWKVAQSHFASLGFEKVSRTDIANPRGRDTRFVGAGLQIYEDLERIPSSARPMVVPQPVIRLNYLEAVGRPPGFSTSFVNLCTEEHSATGPRFLAHLTAWLDMLRVLSIPSSEIAVALSDEPWSGGPYSGPCIVMTVAGVEVGDAIMIDSGPPAVTPLLPIVDFSFGLERLAWACNRQWSYYAFAGPLPDSLDPANARSLDRIRTAVLLIMAGVVPSSRSHGRHLRQLIAEVGRESLHIDYAMAARHAHRFWQPFMETGLEWPGTWDVFESEVARARSMRIARAVRPSRSTVAQRDVATPDQMCRRLLQEGVPLEELVRLVKEEQWI